VLLILTSLRIGWIIYYKEPPHSYAEGGIIDLSNTVFNDNQSISLDGEWAFYPNQFIKPSTQTSETDYEKHFISTPGNWSTDVKDDIPVNYGTYRVKILLPNHNDQLYGIRIQDISSASSIYVNGTLVNSVGQPAETAEHYKSKLGTYKTLFPVKNNEIDMIIHVANYDNPQEGGITSSIKFGTAEAVSKEVGLSKLLQLLVVIVLIGHSLYAFGLYFIGKNKLQKELIYFALLLIFAAFSILVDEDKLLISVLPINAVWSLKLLYISFAGTVYFILKFIQSSFCLKNPTFRILSSLYIILAISLLVVPFQYIIYIGSSIMLVNAISYSFIFVLVLRIIKNGNTDAIYILLANVINLFNVLWGIAIQANMLEIPYYPVDYLLAIMAFSGFLFIRHAKMVNLNAEQTKALQAADKMKDDFLANTSHELRNPLHGIINITETVLNDETESLTAQNKKNLELLVRLGKQMTFTLNDILDVTRLQEQQIRLNKKNVNLHAVTTGVLDMIRFIAEGKNVQISLAVPSSFPEINADENRLIQVLFNLIHNAIKFTDEGSIFINATHKDGFATINIKDTGIGMEKDLQQVIFQPYKQGNTGVSSNGSGIGLGLNICKQFVELHGGEISVKSRLGSGSCFTFTIPLASMSNQRSASELETAATSDTGKLIESAMEPLIPKKVNMGSARILIVDDDPVNLRVLSNMLDLDYNVVTAKSGAEALEYVHTHKLDLVISDVMMPNMSGYTLTESIRKQFTISELPILLLTARSQSEDISAGFLAGANDYVPKPMDALELKARVKALTTLKQSINEQLRIEAAWLQAQIQPHFIFNTLNTIAALGEIDTARMRTLLEQFVIYLRKSFDTHNTQSLVLLKDELDLVRSYLFIEKERFGDRLQIEWKIDDKLAFKVPPLSIQTIVENAVRHGVLKRKDGGTICISISEHKSYHEVAIIDSGIGMSESKIQEILGEQFNSNLGIGIANTNRRLIKLYGKGLVIESKPNHRTTVSFQIPKQ